MDALERSAVLNEEFGQYAVFGPGTKVIYTAEQEAAFKAYDQDAKTNFFTLLTSEQQRRFQDNKRIVSRIHEACGIPEYNPTETRYGFDPDFNPNVVN